MQAIEEKHLIHYRVEAGVGIIEMDDPPANTYPYEMMQQLDSAILKAQMDEDAHVIVFAARATNSFLLGRASRCSRRPTRRSNTTFACTQTKPGAVSNKRQGS